MILIDSKEEIEIRASIFIENWHVLLHMIFFSSYLPSVHAFFGISMGVIKFFFIKIETKYKRNLICELV